MLRSHRPESASSFAEFGESFKKPLRRKQLLAKACDKVIDGLQTLEPRIMLASAAGNVVARFDGSLPTAGSTQQMLLHVTPTIFSTTRTGGTILGFQLSNADGGTLDPAIVQIQSVASGASPAAAIAPLYTKADLANNTQSLALANLPYGDYTITIAGDRNTLGNWHLDIYLVGDVSRSHTVDATDTALMKSIYGTQSTDPDYLVEGDADLNGQIDSTDTALEIRNIGAAVRITALTLTAALSPAPTKSLPDGTPLTNQSAISVTGFTTPGTTVALDLHGGTTFGDGSTIAAPDGSYSIPLTLSEGLNTLRLRATDLFGQSMQATLKVSLDDIPPPVTLTLDPASDTAPAGDNHTTLLTVTLDGQTEPNTPVTLAQGNLTTTSDSTGKFSFAGVSLAIGADGFTVSATDAAGNVGNGSLTVTRDALPPHITSTAPLTGLIGVLYTYPVTATDPQGSLLTYSLPTAPANMVIDPATGKIIWTPTAAQTGQQAVTVRVTNAFGIFDSQSFSVNVAAALTLTAALSPLPTLSLPDGTPLTGSKNISIVGVTSPGATVKLDAHGGTTFGDGTTIAANDGTYSFSLVLTEGLNNLNVQATDSFGQTQTASLKASLDDIAPVVTLTLDPASVSILGGNHTAFSAITLDGVTEPNLVVKLAQGNLTTTADSTGKFSFTNVPAIVGNNPFSASATDAAGNTGTGTLTVIGDAASQTLVEGTHYHVVYQQTITVPAAPSVLQFTYSGLNFDTAAHFVKDAFEGSLIGSDGTSDAFTIGAGHDAFFNVTEGQGNAIARGVNVSPAAGGGTMVSIDLSALPAGEVATLELRLVNDDSDTTTSVTISNVHIQAGGLPTGGTTGPLGLLAAFSSQTGTPPNPSQPGINVVTTTAPASGPVTATTARPVGPSAPSTTMFLTAAGAAAGFTLSNFATGFTPDGATGPLALAYFSNGSVLATNYFGDMHIFPSDMDGQNATTLPAVANYGVGNAIGLAQVGQKIYMTQQNSNAVIQINPDGSFNQTIVTGVPFATGIVAAANGHLFVSASGGIYDIDPIAKTKTIFNNAGADGLIISPDGSTLYAAIPAPGDIQGFNLVSKALVFDSGPIPGTIDGLAVGVGALAGRIFVNTNSGTVVQVDLTTSAQTLLCTGGSRGDFVTVDPNDGSLLLSQSDRFIRLTAPPGGGFNKLVDVQLTATTPQSHVSAGSTILISGHATTTGNSISNPSTHGGTVVPSTTMKLTAAGISGGYTLTTFASGFPFGGSGPIGWALLPNGNVMVTDVGGNVSIFPNDNDGQTTAGAKITQNLGAANGDGIVQVGSHIYVALQGSGSVVELNEDGTLKQTIVTGLGPATGMAGGPDGLLYVSNLGGPIYQVDPIAKTKVAFLSVGADGLGLSADGTILYAESGSQILGFNIATKAQVFDSGVIGGNADGMAVGVGALAGYIFVNTNSGTLVQVNLTTNAQTLLGSGGSRGDLVYVDPSDGSLLLTQTDRILRLIPPPGSGFGNVFPSTIKSVTINGVPVDALDANGNFYANVPVQPGSNGYVVLATDSGGQTAHVTLNVTGDVSNSVTTTNVVDLSGDLSPQFGRTSLNEATGVLYAQVAALNTGQVGVNKPLFVGITNLSDPTITVLNPDGYTDTGIPYFDYSTLVSGNHLEPGQQTGLREISFSDPRKVQFTFTLVPLGVLNSPPVIISLPITNVVAGKPYQYTVTATDADNDPLTFSLTAAPAGMTIDANTGLISYSSATAGNQDVLVSVSDGRGGTAQQRYQLNVISAPSNRPPVFVSAPVVDATAAKAYTYASQALDPDGDPVTYALVPTNYNLAQLVTIVNPGFETDVLGDGIVIHTATGWTELSGDGGAYNPSTNNYPAIPEGQNVLFSNGSVYSQVLTTAAIAGNRYVLTAQVGWPLSLPFAGYAVQLWAGGTLLGQATSPVPGAAGTFITATVDVTVAAGSPAVGNALEIRLVGNGVQEEFDDVRLSVTPPVTPILPVPAGVSIDPNTGVVTWIPTLAQAGQNAITIQASDGKGGAALQSYVVNVASGQTTALANHPPIITSTPPVGPATVGLPYTYAVKALDPDGDSLVYSIPAPPLGMTINAGTGVLTWIPPAGLVGSSHISINVSDGRGGSANQAFDLSVVASSTNTPPVINSTPPTMNEAGKLYVYAVSATDPNIDPLVYSLSTSPSGMVIDPASGLIRWQSSNADIGKVRQVVVSVSDGRGGIATQSFGITVLSQVPNHLPVITSTPPLDTAVGLLYRYDATATDADHDLLIWSLDKAPSGMVVDQSTGTLVWQPQPNQLGTQSVTLHVSDAHGGEVTQSFDINVTSINRPPEINSAPPTAAITAKPYSYAVVATDPEGDPITFSLPSAPVGMTIDAGTGVISWTPSASQIGSNAVIIRATDSHGAIGQQTYNVIATVSATNRPPTITSTPPFVTEPAKLYTYTVTAVDPDLDAVHYALLGGPVGMTIDTSTGIVSWTPTAAQIGAFTVSVAALDTSNAQTTQTYTVISQTNHPPSITSQPILSAIVGATYHYTVTATDPDGDPLAVSLVTAPAGMTIDANGNISWSPAKADVGPHAVQVTVTDPHGASATQSYSVNVTADTTPPKIQIIVDHSPANVGDLVNIQVAAVDGIGISNRTLLVDGQPVALDINGIGAVRMTHAGDIALIATATDAAGNVATATGDELVIDPTNTSAPTVDITSPGDGSTIRSLTDIIGTVTDPNLLFYTLSLAPSDGSGDFKEFFRSTSNITNAKLGSLDPTMLANDTYILRLDAVNAGGNEAETEVEVEVAGNLKLGNFTLTFTDLKTTVTGIPITVSRTYDTLNADTQGDFGYGWRLEFGNTQLRTNLPTSPLADAGVYTGFVPGTRVYITVPGGAREGFTFNATAAPGIKGSILGIVNPGFVADPGVTDKLAVAPADLYFFADAGEFQDYSGDLPYNPADPAFGGTYTLTTKSGVVYQIDANTGSMLNVSDRNGNSLTYSSDGIKSSTGVSVTFERDAKGRITGVVDPSGKKITYQYDASGDLASVTDRIGGVTNLSYLSDPAHYLQQIVDPLGHTALSNTYGPDGRLTGVTNGDGQTNHVTFDTAHSTQSTTDALGNTTLYGYDANGNLILDVAPDGSTTKYTYDANGNVLSETDPDGHVTATTYSTIGNVLSETDANGKTISYSYNTLNEQTSATDALGNTTTYTYDSLGNLQSTQRPDGSSLTVSTNKSGQLSSLVDAAGQSTTFQYDSTGHLTLKVDALGTPTQYTYDANGNLLTTTTLLTTPGGVRTLVTTNTYDAEGNQLSTTDADGRVTSFEYNGDGEIVASIDPAGNRTTYQYDDAGRLTATIYADGTSSLSTYDADGHLISTTDQAGNVTKFVRDLLDRVIKTIYPDSTPLTDSDNPTSQTMYDPAGLVLATIDELGNRTEYTYDAAGNRIKIHDALGNDTLSTYDADGRLTSVTDALQHVTTYTYDAAGRQLTTVFADGSSIKHVYDSLGHDVQDIDQLGHKTSYTYDADGRLSTVTDALGGVTKYAYDEAGDMVSKTDAKNQVTTYEYDGTGHRIATVLPMGQRSTTTYGASGNVVSSTDFDGAVTTYDYNNMNRVTAMHFADGTSIHYTYTPLGSPATLTDSRGVTTYTYDARNELLSRVDPDGATISYTYDAVGNRLTTTTPSHTVTYTYDALNRMASVSTPGIGTTTYHYDALGNLIETDQPNGVVETRQYDALDRLTLVASAGPGNTPITHFAYTLDAGGNRVREDDLGGRSVTYTYDALNRLTQEAVTDPANGNRTYAYTYDSVGERLTRSDSVGGNTTYTYDANGRLLTETTGAAVTTYTYDANGSTLTKFTSATDHSTYVYDARGDLVTVTTVSPSGTDITQYTYDATGIQVSSTDNGVETRELIDTSFANPQVAETYVPGAGTVVTYTRGLDLIAEQRGANVSFYETDALGSTRALTNAAGVFTDSYIYDAFGQSIAHIGSTLNNFLFAGQSTDPNTGLDYLRARYYDPSTGLLLGRDPFDGLPASPLTEQPYLYALQNPVNRVDPSGRFSLAELSIANAIESAGDAAESIGKKLAAYADVREIEFLINTAYLIGGISLGLIEYFALGGTNYNDLTKAGTQLFSVQSEDPTFPVKGVEAYLSLQGSDKIFDLSIAFRPGGSLDDADPIQGSVQAAISIDLSHFSKSKIQAGYNFEVGYNIGPASIAKFGLVTRGNFPLGFEADLEATFLGVLKVGTTVLEYANGQFQVAGITLNG